MRTIVNAAHASPVASVSVYLKVLPTRRAIKVHLVRGGAGKEAVRESDRQLAGAERRLDLRDRRSVKRHPRILLRGAPLPRARELHDSRVRPKAHFAAQRGGAVGIGARVATDEVGRESGGWEFPE